MPKAKRVQVVSLTKTKSKGKNGRREIMDNVTNAVNTYDYVWVFSVANMRNQYLKQVRNKLSTSRFFLGSNKVMAKALGNGPEDEIKENLHKISEALVGDVGLLFTNMSVDEVKKSFDEFEASSYPRAGNIAEYKVVVKAGEVVRGHTEESFPNNMEPTLRQLGMPTLLKQGKIMLDNDYVICEKGDVLSPNQAHLLKHFWEKMATFKIKLVAYWHQNGEFVQLESEDSDNNTDQDME
ncbi:mRNA turnover and ribosome assembly protein [Coemansia brasiliensis]|uniref:Ribosome assembly factor mrt4 n=1 Tax=Coemansia brasiliensis TaxID=2650707 RepID=A0A9W8LYI1_9FUNG|nr:mRNA turnover and ribosome assembly protein [Coemansia brasiliensis]